MRNFKPILVASWRDLWAAPLVVAGAGLLATTVVLLSQALSWDLTIEKGGIADWPTVIAALWGGVVVVGGADREQVFFLVRPMVRLQWTGTRLVMLLLLTITTGFGVNLLASAAGVGETFPALWVLVVAPFVALCGMTGGLMQAERGPALGLAGVLAWLIGQGAVSFGLYSIGADSNPLAGAGPRDGLVFLVYGLASALFAPPLSHWVVHWAPLRTKRAINRLTALLGGSMALLALLVWLFAPLAAAG